MDSEIPNKQQAGFWGSPFQKAALVSTGCASPRVLGTGAVASGAALAARTVTTATTGVGGIGAAPAGSGGAGAGGSNSPGSAQPQPLPSQRPAGALGVGCHVRRTVGLSLLLQRCMLSSCLAGVSSAPHPPTPHPFSTKLRLRNQSCQWCTGHHQGRISTWPGQDVIAVAVAGCWTAYRIAWCVSGAGGCGGE